MDLLTKEDWRWLVSRIEEMAWSPYDKETCQNLGLWLGMIQSIAFTGIKEIKDKDNQVV